LRNTLNAALETLSPAIRTTFTLFAEAELSYKEIADCQGVPVGTVMSRLHYARQKLMAQLDGVEGLDVHRPD
ncbi:MAG TPA: sigma factor-like helix-turn-helix DNA-binding protein, partial [Isosphaeraceae bacterium]|nr:sigma factor-like helix-turn-helix DNA-binding protein [Isosphaeraceae bacterium]